VCVCVCVCVCVFGSLTTNKAVQSTLQKQHPDEGTLDVN